MARNNEQRPPLLGGPFLTNRPLFTLRHNHPSLIGRLSRLGQPPPQPWPNIMGHVPQPHHLAQPAVRLVPVYQTSPMNQQQVGYGVQQSALPPEASQFHQMEQHDSIGRPLLPVYYSQQQQQVMGSVQQQPLHRQQINAQQGTAPPTSLLAPSEVPQHAQILLGHHQPSQPLPQGGEVAGEPLQEGEDPWYPACEESFKDRVDNRYQLDIKDIKVDLSVGTYKKKFNNLICWEEKSNIDILGKRCDAKCDLTLFQSGDIPAWIRSQYTYREPMRYGFLENVTFDQIAYATQASEAVFIISHKNVYLRMEILRENYEHCVERLYVAFREDESQYLACITNSHSLTRSETVIHGLFIEFEVKHEYFDSLVKAVNSIQMETIRRLLPSRNDFLPPTLVPEFDLKALLSKVPPGIEIDQNSQFDALRAILACNRESPPLIVYGSFGTGKTRLLAVATHCLFSHGIYANSPVRILVTAHHYHSSDQFIQQYFGSMFGKEKDITLIRLYDDKYRIRGSRFSYLYKSFKELQEYQCQNEYPQFLLIVTEFLTALPLLEIYGRNYFTHILMDEGSQAVEPQSIGALCLAGPNTKIVIAGDPCQVGPSLMVLGEEARENGLKFSLQERLQKLYRKLGGPALDHTVSLNTNYRCHESIIQIPNRLFYESKILARPLNALPHHLANFPLLFVCSSLTEEVDPNFEAKLLLDNLDNYVLSHWPADWGERDWRKICLTTATRTQLVVTRTLLRQKYPQLARALTILTTYTIQGKEFQAVFLSTTEPVDADGNTTNPTKSPCDPYVFNTVLTRSKSLVVAIGSPLALLKIQDHMEKVYGRKAQCWSNYLELCLEKETFVIPPEVGESRRKRKRFRSLLKSRLLKKREAEPAMDSTTVQRISTSHSVMADSTAIEPNQPHPSLTVDQITATAALQSSNHHTTSVPPSSVTSRLPSQPTTFISSSSVNVTPSSLPSHLSLVSPSGLQTTTALSHFPASNITLRERHHSSVNITPVPVPRRDPNASPAPLRLHSDITPRLPHYHPSIPAPTSLQQIHPMSRLPTTSITPPQLYPSSSALMPPGTMNVAPESLLICSSGLNVSNQYSSPAVVFPHVDPPNVAVEMPVAPGSSLQYLQRFFYPKKQHAERKHSSKKPTRSSKKAADSKPRKDTESLLKEELTAENYKERFHALLDVEEQEQRIQLTEKYNGIYEVVLFKPRFIPRNLEEDGYVQFGYITSDNADFLANAKQASESSLIMISHECCVRAKHVRGKLPDWVDSNAILIGFDREQFANLQAANMHGNTKFKVEVKFEIQKAYFNRLHKALDNLSDSVVQKLIPSIEVFSNYKDPSRVPVSTPPYKSIMLDGYAQLSALYLILKSSPDLPVLVAGSFGTGKTRLLARAAYEILKSGGSDSRVLICAHHQSSVETFVNYFGEMKSLENENFWGVNMVRVTANDSYVSNTRDRYDDLDIYRSKYNLENLQQYQLVLTTFSTAASLFWKVPQKMCTSKGFFSHILIDEGAQVREPEMVCALTLAGSETRIVIAGDHFQVGPKILVLGEKAQTHGLGVSPLERLYNLYDKEKDLLSDSLSRHMCSITLLTNYRCHSSILMLPSSLYYQSTLLSRAESITHPLAPFPLIFVCTDIQQEFQGTAGANMKEADALVKTVEKHFKEWPDEWEVRDESKSRIKKICIMTSSPVQYAILKKKKINIDRDIKCEVLTVYNIQGNEFDAIFISTSEPTNEACEPLDPTKSICDRFVFNTVITRSRSLVVAFGNPFLLLKMEESMVKKHGDDYRTWKPFIKQCLECNSFSYSDDVKALQCDINPTTHHLYDQVYSDNARVPVEPDLKFTDSILENYQKVFEGMRGCKRMRLVISSGKDARLTWNVQEAGNFGRPKEEIRFSDEYLCRLNFLSYRKVEAIPVSDPSKKDVLIQGKRNLKNAFDGDTVMVGVFDDCPPNKQYGRVTKVHKRGSDLRYMCRVADYSSIAFFPIDKKNPKLINLPTLSRVILRKKRREEMSETDLEYNDVFVFDPNSYEFDTETGIRLPRVVQVIPHSVAKKMLFLVKFVVWKKYYANPLGMVIGMCSLGHTLLKAELLLKMEHSVSYNSADDDSADPYPPDATEDPTVPCYTRAFTIDPCDAQNLDDALSITYKGGDNNGYQVYHIGVHIVNAAKHIVAGSDEDTAAKKLGISVYGGKKGCGMMHMLGNRNTRRSLSLFPTKLRDILSVTCDVTMLDTHCVSITPSSISPAQLRSAFKLSYAQAQELLKNIIPPPHAAAAATFDANNSDPSLCESMKLLYNVAMMMRHRRLQSNSAFTYDIDDPGEGKNWQAHLLVSELMIWANNEVAKKIHSIYPNAAILCKQDPPFQEKLESAIEQSIDTITGSLQLSRYLVGSGNGNLSVAGPGILVPHNLLNRALTESDPIFLAHLLSSDKLYPQLAAAASNFLSISKRSEYCCTDERKTDPSAYRHYSLCLDKYTHFTSPIRRYVDIVVQRILTERSSLSHEELEELCVVFNKSKKNASSFEKAIKRVRLASDFLSNSEVCTAFVSQHHGPMSVELSFYDVDLKYKDLPVTAKRLDTNRCFPSSKESDVYTWKLRVTSLSKDFAAKLLQIPGFSVSTNVPTSQCNSDTHRLKAYCSSDDTTLDIQHFRAIPHDHGVVVTPQNWLQLQELIKQPTEEKAVEVKRILKSISFRSPAPNTSIEDFLFLDCDVKLPLKEADSVKLWLSWSTKEPVISPVIQLLEVSPLLRICVQHNTHPADCFSDPDLTMASQEMYFTLEHYVMLWKKVLLAEAAVKSVHDCQPTVIQGVYLKWPQFKVPSNCIEVQHYIPSDLIEMVLPINFVLNCSEFFKLRVGDLVCVRYGCVYHHDERVRAVYHLVVHDVEEPERGEEKDTLVHLEPVGEVNCQISQDIKEKLKSDSYLCEIQIVPMSISYRKVYRGLIALKKGSELSKNVAVDTSRIKEGSRDLKKYAKDIENIIAKDKLATSISKWDPKSNKDMALNDGQKEALRRALTNQFQLIQGPPGTGKSVTGAHIAYALARLNHIINTRQGSHKCVLYCGPSNKSVDVVFKKFVELFQAQSDVDLRILRIYSSAVEKKDFPGPRHQTQQVLPDNACPDWAREHSLHHLIRHHDNTEEEFVVLKRLEKKLDDMANNNKIASGKLCNEYRKALNKAEEKFLSRKKFDIIFCTCNEASGGRMKRHWRQLTPRQCIIDECGMAYEPETIVPISVCEHAVLIGDHKQLEPVIEYQPARDNGLIISLFERYAKKSEYFEYKHLFYKLKTQYRMHEAICEFPSKQFYDNELKAGDSVLTRKDNQHLENFWPKGNRFPIMFVDVVGEEGQDIDGDKREAKVGVDSKFNKKEADVVIEIAKTLHYKHQIALSEIAVLTPYSAQKNQILKIVREDAILKDLKVASITESQGDEYGIVILSTVRSLPLEEIKHKHYVQPDRSWMTENLGFITDDHQINVGITRSKHGLVIIGNKTLLAYYKTWEELLIHYEKIGCVVDQKALFVLHSKTRSVIHSKSRGI